MVRGAIWIVLGACSTQPSPTLTLDGPDRVRVTTVGPVEAGPTVVLDDGSAPEGVSWNAEPPAVAVVRGGVVHAVGPGEAVITASWKEQEVRWTLQVDATIALTFVDPPASLSVGDEVVLQVQGVSGESPIAVPALTWTSSNRDVLTVDGGRAMAFQPGTVYVTAAAGDSSAQLELMVR